MVIIEMVMRITNCKLPFEANKSMFFATPKLKIKNETNRRNMTKTKYLILFAFSDLGFFFKT